MTARYACCLTVCNAVEVLQLLSSPVMREIRVFYSRARLASTQSMSIINESIEVTRPAA
jgi:hypothetical protein